MSLPQQSRLIGWSIFAVVLAFVGYFIWQWEVERVEVPSGQFLIKIHRWGKDLAPNEIVAPDDAHKGVMLEPFGEGRHFLNPLIWGSEIHPLTTVKPGECNVLVRTFGELLPQGEVLANGDHTTVAGAQRGVLREVLPPGSYRINPYAYKILQGIVVQVQSGEVGVRELKVGKDPSVVPFDPQRGHYVVPDGYRGVQQTPVPPGTYYINPFVESIAPVDVRSHRVNLTDIEFPSRDGFILRPQVLVEYSALEAKAPELMTRLSDGERLHQFDQTPAQQSENEILQKVILPHIRGYARIEGSNFDARDFILMGPAASPKAAEKAANAREALQRALFDKVKPKCDELGVVVLQVRLADMHPPQELSEQIKQRELARVERERNVVRLGQYRAEQNLKAKEALKVQAKDKVEAETRLVQAKTKSEQLKQVAGSRLKQELSNAELSRQAAEETAKAILAKGKAESAVITAKNQAEVAGLRQAVEGFGAPRNYADYKILARLGPALTEIFASDDSDFARVFSAFMTPSNEAAKAPITSRAGSPTSAPTER